MYHRDGEDRHRWGYNVSKGGAAGLMELRLLMEGYSALQTPMQLVGTLNDDDNKYISRRNNTCYGVQHHPLQINRLLEPLRKHYNIPTLPIIAPTREEVVAIRHKLTMILQHWTDYCHQQLNESEQHRQSAYQAWLNKIRKTTGDDTHVNAF